MPTKVLITRAPHQASELADRLRAAGMEPVLIPTIELAPPLDSRMLPACVAQLHTYDWLLFTSANAVDAFARARAEWRESQSSDASAEGIALKIAAIGPATARAVTGLGLRVDLVPPQAIAESFASALLAHARNENGGPARFLLVRAEEARDHLPETLRAAGADVTIAPAYRNVAPTGSAEALRVLFSSAEKGPAAITFTSSSTVTNLLDLLRASGLALPLEVLRASIGPITTRTLVEAGLPPHVEAEEATVASLAESVRLLLSSR